MILYGVLKVFNTPLFFNLFSEGEEPYEESEEEDEEAEREAGREPDEE